MSYKPGHIDGKIKKAFYLDEAVAAKVDARKSTAVISTTVIKMA